MTNPASPPRTSNAPLPLRLADVAGEAALLAGGGAAILLQLAHPAVGRGVARHSDFTGRPLDRLFGTLDYVYTVAFGDEQMVAFVVRGVNRAHAPVHDRASTPGYNAFDPQLQLWVAATLYHAAMQVHDRLLGRLDAESAEAVYRDYAALGARLQMPVEHWPADRAEFERYWHEALAGLRATPESAAVVTSLLNPRTLPVPLRGAMPLIRLLSIGLLPASVRELHELPWGAREQARFDRTLALVRVAYRRMPRRLRHLPRDRALARVRRAMREQPAPRPARAG
ncbi:oxygenase MpaB family protein [Microterricola pindariensis]|uniref:ER-bound oxygenase mpaB/mpaB'/Rubber oxygenase catalytic domain-containing protein n=1 Tax=Microterricola pindariensis TaxID=478010 RepID=A0ABX5B177_9MICO|nr:oxygenase MpaB family protein [Microterricola pindariensis]PPL20591.1 hypothetical protein GY24_00140 [Microterricola pindariensis]